MKNQMKNNLKKRFFAATLAVLMVFGCISGNPLGTMAAAPGGTVSDNESSYPDVSGNDTNTGARAATVSENDPDTREGSVMCFTLTYGNTSEEYSTFGEVCDRITELNNADNEYIIEYGNDMDGDERWWFSNLPTVAGSLTINVLEDEILETPMLDVANASYPIYINSDMIINSGNCNLSELHLGEDVELSIESGNINKAVLADNASLFARNELTIGTLEVTGNVSLDITRCVDSDTDETISIGSYNITSIEMAQNATIRLWPYSCEENMLVLKTSSNLTDDQLTYELRNPWIMEKQANQDGTYSYVVKKDTKPMFRLSYGNKNEEYTTYAEVLERMNGLNNSNNTYHITILGDDNFIDGLPAKAKKIKFSSAPGYYSMLLDASTDAYPIETDTYLNLQPDQSIGEVTLLKNGSISIYDNSSIDNLKAENGNSVSLCDDDTSIGKVSLSASTSLNVYASAEIGEIKFIRTNADNTYPYWYIDSIDTYVNGNYKSTSYGKLKLGKLEMGSTSQHLTINCGGEVNPEDNTVLEVSSYTSAWNQVTVQRAWGSAENGYNLVKKENADKSFSYEWVEDTAVKFVLSYGDTESEHVTFKGLLDEIDQNDDATVDYTIEVVSPQDDNCSYSFTKIPTAKSISIISDERRDVSFDISLDAEVSVPLNFEGVSVSLAKPFWPEDAGLNLSKISISNGVINVGNDVRIEELLMDSDTSMSLFGYVEIGTLTYENSADTTPWIYCGQTWIDNSVYLGCLHVDTLDIDALDLLVYNPYLFYYEPQSGTNIMEIGSVDDESKIKFTGSTGSNSNLSIVREADGDGIIYKLAEVTGKFAVTYGDTGESFGTFSTWNDLLDAFNKSGDTAKEYVINITNGSTISSLMPDKAKKITIKSDSNYIYPQVYVNTSSISQFTDMEIDNVFFINSNTRQSITINVNGKNLILNGDSCNFNKISGNNGTLTVNDYATVGSMQKLSKIIVPEEAGLFVYDTVSDIKELCLDGDLTVWGSKAVTFKNIVAGDNAQLIFQCQDTLNQNITITGSILKKDKTPGTIALKYYEFIFDQFGTTSAIRNFAVGTKLLKAPDCTPEQFVIDGAGMACYKVGDNVYAGMEALKLYNDEDYIGTYARWSDIASVIDKRADAKADYTVRIMADFNVGGTLTMPSKGKYNSLTLESDTEDNVRKLMFTGNISLTGNLVVSDVVLEPLTSSGAVTRCSLLTGDYTINFAEHSMAFSSISGKGAVYVADDAEVDVSGAVNVASLTIGSQAVFGSGNLTIDNLEAKDGAILDCKGTLKVSDTLSCRGEDTFFVIILMEKKEASINDTLTDGSLIRVIAQNADGDVIKPAAGTILFKTTGNTYASEYVLIDEYENERELYRSGNNIKVSDGTAPVELWTGEGETKVYLGTYGSLADIKTQIETLKNKNAVYTVDVKEDLLISGAVPMPSAGTFDKLIFTGAKIQTTATKVTLTGDTEFRTEIVSVKSAQDISGQAISINIGKYTLTVNKGYEISLLGEITGKAGSGLVIGSNVAQTVSGKVTGIGTLCLDGKLSVGGDIELTDVKAGDEGVLEYDLAKKFTVKGNVVEGKLKLSPLSNETEVTEYTVGMTVIDSAKKADVDGFVMARDTRLRFYRDKDAVKLGDPVINVTKEGSEDNASFISFNDATAYIDKQGDGSYTISLDGDVPSFGAITMPKGVGKNVRIIGNDGTNHTLNFTGSVTIDGAQVEIDNVKLNNSKATGAAFTLKNGAGLMLSDTMVNSVTAPAGTIVTLGDGAVLNGALKGACDLTVKDGAVIRFKDNVTVKTLKLDGTEAQFRILKGKLVTVNSTVDIGPDKYIILNYVDNNDNLADILVNTKMLSASGASVLQFKTDNIMNGTADVKWLLTESNGIIKTAALLAYAYPEGDRQIDKQHQFASFNDAKVYVGSQDGDYVIELLSADSNADLSNIPDNLSKIIKSQQTTASSILIKTSKDINLTRDLVLENVVINAKGKALNASGHELELIDGAGVTAAKVVSLQKITIGDGIVNITGSSGNQINNVVMNGKGTMKCPSYSGF